MRPPTELSPEMLTDKRVRQAFIYWDGLRRNRSMPGRSDIDPLDLRFCLGWICMIDVLPGSKRKYRYRLDGSKLVELTGFDLTGKYVDQIASADYRQLAEMAYGRVVATKRPLFLGNMEDWLQRGFFMESAALPLSEDDDTVTTIMEVVCPARTLMPDEISNYLLRSIPNSPLATATTR